jgi:two-component system sensor histidine kinase RegB
MSAEPAPSSPPSAVAPDERGDISLDWLIRLRWGAVAGQLGTILVAQALWGGLPVAWLLVPVAALAASNALVAAFRKRLGTPRLLCGAALTLDTLLITILLALSGGAYNPFSVLYLVHIALAATVLGSRWTWFLAALSIACYGLLFLAPQSDPHVGHRAADELGVHLQGMWVAFVVAALLTAYFVVRLSSDLERREVAMALMRERAARQERLAAVTTLAAGAAHELGTPLATIAVASRELERQIRELPEPQSRALAEDAALIRSELERCRAILDRLATDSGSRPGEAPQAADAPGLVAEIVAGLPAAERARLRVEEARPGSGPSVPRGALVQVALSLLQNAFEAGKGPVRLAVEASPSRLVLLVEDEGCGMPPEVLARAGEPYFSTKTPGAGLGLGLFIARSLSEQMGGRLRLESGPGRGTRATVEVEAPSPMGAGHAA